MRRSEAPSNYAAWAALSSHSTMASLVKRQISTFSQRLRSRRRMTSKLSQGWAPCFSRYRVYVQRVGVATPPSGYADRVARMFPATTWKRLKLFALDATDLALTKLERNAERDREDVLRLAQAGMLNPRDLKDRYVNELRPYLLGKHAWHDKTLELWIEMAWPSK